jgi:hypothetical protein
MNTERLIRQVEKRLSGVGDNDRAEILDALREEIARERRWLDPSPTIERERERRQEAETFREVLEAINRPAGLEDTIEQVLKQLARVVVLDYCSVALSDGGGRFRVIGSRGGDQPRAVGSTFHDPLTESAPNHPWPISVPDVQGDPQFADSEIVTSAARSWAGIPLFVEGELIGLVCLERHRVDPFSDEDLHRAKAIAFSGAAAIRKARQLEQVRRYSELMDKVAAVDQAVFAGRPLEEVGQVILEGALHVGSYPGGLLVLRGKRGPELGAAVGVLSGIEGSKVPVDLEADSPRRLRPERVPPLGEKLGIALPPHWMYLVPLSTADARLGNLALLDPDGESPDDRLMEAYASRAAAAYLHALRDHS